MSDHRGYVLTLSPAELARYRLMAGFAQQEEAADWAAAGVVVGARVADVGCGPAALSVALAGVVGPAGRVDAVDRDPAALAMAEQVVAQSGADNVRLTAGTADATGLDAAGFDVVMLRHVLAHNGGREQAIVDHLATLARPGGSVYLLDVELSAYRMLPPDPDLAELEARYRAFHHGLGNDLSVGLRLGALLRRAGLADVRHRGWYSIITAPPGIRPATWAALPAMMRAGVVSEADVERWERRLGELDAAPQRPTLFVPLFAAWGSRPG
jgi:SAM-dependent methyltransferase